MLFLTVTFLKKAYYGTKATLPLRPTLPYCLIISPIIACSKLDLPEPTCPTIQTNYPGSTFIFISVRIVLLSYAC